MPVAPVLAVAAVATMAVGTAMTISAQNKARKAQQKQFKYQKSMDSLRAAKERKEAIRAARLSRGAAQQAGVNQGAENSSASIGGLGSIDTQLNQGLSFLDQNNYLADQATIQAGKINKYQAKAQTGQSITQLGAAVFQNSTGLGDLATSVFGKGT